MTSLKDGGDQTLHCIDKIEDIEGIEGIDHLIADLPSYHSSAWLKTDRAENETHSNDHSPKFSNLSFYTLNNSDFKTNSTNEDAASSRKEPALRRLLNNIEPSKPLTNVYPIPILAPPPTAQEPNEISAALTNHEQEVLAESKVIAQALIEMYVENKHGQHKPSATPEILHALNWQLSTELKHEKALQVLNHAKQTQQNTMACLFCAACVAAMAYLGFGNFLTSNHSTEVLSSPITIPTAISNTTTNPTSIEKVTLIPMPMTDTIEKSNTRAKQEKIRDSKEATTSIEKSVKLKKNNLSNKLKYSPKPYLNDQNMIVIETHKAEKSAHETAYQKLQAGDKLGAQNLYQQILHGNQKDIDALVGLGSIAHQQGKLNLASKHFMQALKINPSHAYSLAVMASLSSSALSYKASQGHNPKEAQSHNEAEIQALAKNNPNSAEISFILGNLYAAKKSWSQAQTAYFNAYNINSHNADYAYNLAISLDHLGKAPSALTYYNKSLQLATKAKINFDKAAILTRIHALTIKESTNTLEKSSVQS